MGADFCFIDVPAAKIDADRKNRLLEIIAGLNEESPDFRDSGLYDEIEECRATLIAAVESLESAPDSRETTLFGLPGAEYEVWLTGGMSWGDAPTDIYEQFVFINSSESIVKMLEQWAAADSRAKNAAARIGATKEDGDE